MFHWKLRSEDNKDPGPKGNSNPPPKLTVESVDNHCYFYSEVNSDRGLALIKNLRELDTKLRNEHASRSLPEDHPLTPIWLHIESPGGNLFTAFSIAEQIKRLKTPVYSVVEGYTASAATIISIACSKRFILPSAFMLIHQLSSFHWGKYEEFRDEMNLLDMAMETLVSFYVNNTKMKKTKVSELLKRDSWFNAKQSLDAGLVDKIL